MLLPAYFAWRAALRLRPQATGFDDRRIAAFPDLRQQGVEFVLFGPARHDPFKHIAQPHLGIDAISVDG
jgi:hypothetical protein